MTISLYRLEGTFYEFREFWEILYISFVLLNYIDIFTKILGTGIDLSKRIMLRCTWYMFYGRYFLWILAILRNCDLKRLHFFCLNIDLFIKISGIDLSKRIALGEVYSIQHYVIKICQLLAAGQWFSPATRVSSINKTAILLKVVLITITPTLKGSFNISNPFLYHTTIWFVSDLRQVGGFLQVLCFPPPTKLTATI